MCQIDAFVSHSAFGSNSGAGEPLCPCESEKQKCLLNLTGLGNAGSPIRTLDPSLLPYAIHAGLPFSMPPPKVLKAFVRWDETIYDGVSGMFLGTASQFASEGYCCI